MWSVFHFMFYVLELTILNLAIVSKINLPWRCLSAFSNLRCTQFKLEKPSTEKLKFKHRDQVFSLILWNSKNTWVCICENKSYIVAPIMAKHASIFCKIPLTRCTNPAFPLFSLIQMKLLPYLFTLRKGFL